MSKKEELAPWLVNKMKQIVSSKRSQEEMIGFVLIIVLVAVIALVFLAISIRKPAEIIDKKEIQNFLYSSLLYTTSCYESGYEVHDLRSLIKACYSSEKCLDSRESCKVLNETMAEIIEKSWVFEENAVKKGYVFKIYDESNVSFIHLSEGVATGTIESADVLIDVGDGNVYAEMKIFSWIKGFASALEFIPTN